MLCIEITSPRDLKAFHLLKESPACTIGIGDVEALSLLENALELGADDILVRPFRPSLLSRRIHEMLRPEGTRTTGRYRAIPTEPSSFGLREQGSPPSCLSALIRNAELPLGLVVDGYLREINPAFEATLPCSISLPLPLDQLIGRLGSELRAMPTRVESGASWSATIRAANGAPHRMVMRSIAGHPNSAILFVYTEEGPTRDREAASELSVFIGGLTKTWHDRLTSPIGVIGTNLAFLSEHFVSDAGANPDVRDVIDEMNDAVAQMRTLLADMSLMTVGHVDPAEPVDLAALLDSAARYVTSQHARLSVEVHVPLEIGPRVVERSRLAQLVSHLLLAFALGHGPSKDMDRIEVTATCTREMLHIRVVSRELVVDEEFIRNVRDLSKISAGPRESAPIQFCRLVAQSMGGELSIDRAPEGGICATLALPAPACTPARALRASGSYDATPSTSHTNSSMDTPP